MRTATAFLCLSLIAYGASCGGDPASENIRSFHEMNGWVELASGQEGGSGAPTHYWVFGAPEVFDVMRLSLESAVQESGWLLDTPANVALAGHAVHASDANGVQCVSAISLDRSVEPAEPYRRIVEQHHPSLFEHETEWESLILVMYFPECV